MANALDDRVHAAVANGEPLAGDAARDERSEALPGRAREADADRIVRQPLAAPPLRDVVAERGTHRAVDVADRQPQLDGLLVLDGLPARRNDRRAVERALERVI